jgi:hypothetical protein
MNFRRLWYALLAGALVWGTTSGLRRLAPAPAFGPVTLAGSFTPGGEYPGEPLAVQPAPRTWASWAGSDANVGTLRLGPFPASARLRLALSGYPNHPGGNALFLEMAGLPLRLPLPAGDAHERWVVEEFEIPAGWQGRMVTLVAVDASRELGGWLGVSEPLTPAGGWRIERGVVATLAAWICNGLLLGLGFAAAARWLAHRELVAPPWIPLAAGGVVALCGYVAFWAYFLHPLAGRLFSAAVLGAAGVIWVRTTSAPPRAAAELRGVAMLLVCAGLFHLAVLHLFSEPRDFYDLAANRYITGLPGDNRLPHDFAMRLYHGESPKNLSADWLSSDRPPLQTGWQLLTWPVTAFLGFGAITASGTSAVWLQLLWVAAAYGLLRTLGLSQSRALAWGAVLTLGGFFIHNTVFTWPKLSAAAFACGAFGVWMLEGPRDQGTKGPKDQKTTENESPLVPSSIGPLVPSRLLGAMLAALAWLSHGGVAFSFLALAPWAAWRAARGEFRAWLGAAVAFLLLTLPWFVYQQVYEPPANRLVKWHLGGQEARDARGTWETIRDGYRALSWHQIAERKVANFKLQFAGTWPLLGDFSVRDARIRRQDEFYYTARALGWWIGGAGLLAVALIRPGSRARLAGTLRPHVALLGWTLATLAIWCLLMFDGGHAVIHQGSYAVMLVSFVLLSAWSEAAGRGWIIVLAVLQAATLAATYLVPTEVISGPPSGWPLVAVAATALAGFVVAGFFRAPNSAGR